MGEGGRGAVIASHERRELICSQRLSFAYERWFKELCAPGPSVAHSNSSHWLGCNSWSKQAASARLY